MYFNRSKQISAIKQIERMQIEDGEILLLEIMVEIEKKSEALILVTGKQWVSCSKETALGQSCRSDVNEGIRLPRGSRSS